AVLEVEHERRARLEHRAVAAAARSMDRHGLAVAREQLLDLGTERPAGARPELAEVAQHVVAAAVLAGDGARARLVEDDVLVQELDQRRAVAGVERLVAAADARSVLFGCHRCHRILPGRLGPAECPLPALRAPWAKALFAT